MPPIGDFLAFFAAAAFTASWEKLGLNDQDLVRLQQQIIDDPTAGDVVAGTGGLRKMRFAPAGGGKRGGVRVCYTLFPDRGTVYLVTAFGKSRKTDLSPAEKKATAAMISEFAAWLG